MTDTTSSGPSTLVIDIGGTGLKMITIDGGGAPLNERARELTPRPATPKAVLEVLTQMLAAQPPSARVSVGFPGVVVRGKVVTAPNLGTKAWAGFDLHGALAEVTERPVHVINDAELQGYGVIEGRGVELVLTLGTGMGAGLYTDGVLVPNLELGHHPLRKGKSYEERISNAALQRIGKKKWNVRLQQVLAQLEPIFNYDHLYLGGGNAKKIRFDLPPKVSTFTNVEGLRGGLRLWQFAKR